MRASTETTKAKRYLEMARQIAEREKHFISPSVAGSPITELDYADLTDLIGEEIFFDDDGGFWPTEDTRAERVMFLCFAATAPQ